jgi:hypothetical protein
MASQFAENQSGGRTGEAIAFPLHSYCGFAAMAGPKPPLTRNFSFGPSVHKVAEQPDDKEIYSRQSQRTREN